MSGFEIVFKIKRATALETASIRHDVFCEEMGYRECNKDRVETDDYDPDSIHCLTTDSKNAVTGCVRIIKEKDRSLHFQKFSDVDLRQFSKNTTGEISRLAVAKNNRMNSPFTLPALCMGCLVMAQEDGIQVLFMVCDKTLSDSISRSGIQLDQVGEYHDVCGQRAPFMLTVESAIKKIQWKYPPLWRYVSTSLNSRSDHV